jgi:hypothetical protein
LPPESTAVEDATAPSLIATTGGQIARIDEVGNVDADWAQGVAVKTLVATGSRVIALSAAGGDVLEVPSSGGALVSLGLGLEDYDPVALLVEPDGSVLIGLRLTGALVRLTPANELVVAAVLPEASFRMLARNESTGEVLVSAGDDDVYAVFP